MGELFFLLNKDCVDASCLSGAACDFCFSCCSVDDGSFGHDVSAYEVFIRAVVGDGFYLCDDVCFFGRVVEVDFVCAHKS